MKDREQNWRHFAMKLCELNDSELVSIKNNGKYLFNRSTVHKKA